MHKVDVRRLCLCLLLLLLAVSVSVHVCFFYCTTGTPLVHEKAVATDVPPDLYLFSQCEDAMAFVLSFFVG